VNIGVGLGTVGASDWHDRPVALVGGGPSLAGFDFERLRGRFRVVAINATVFDIPWVDAGFSLDQRAMRNWWGKYTKLNIPLYFAIPKSILVNMSERPTANMRFIRRFQGEEFNSAGWMISCGGSSGYGALQLAFKKRARKIVLLGFDYGFTQPGVWHHNEHHYNFWQSQSTLRWRQFAASFNVAAPVLKTAGVEVINASPSSTITCFPRLSIDEAIE
jgi:hypothetical protein